MSQEQLKKNIVSLAKLRKSEEILVYITGDKKPLNLFATKIAIDALSIFDKHLYKIGPKKKISLFLYSTGGSLDAVWPLVSLFREYCLEFEIIIPNKALSAATLICLGADKIVMTPHSLLSPIDPQGSFGVGQNRKNIQVEDVVGFLDFAKTRVGISEQNSLTEILKVLSSEIPPSVLGSIHRTHSLIRLLAEKLLSLHKEKVKDHRISQIIENLTEKLFSHQHLIGRVEAKNEIGFKEIINFATKREEKLIKKIFNHYQKMMKLEEMFNPNELFNEDDEEGVVKTVELKRAIIGSSIGEDFVVSKYEIKRNEASPPANPYDINIEDLGWKDNV